MNPAHDHEDEDELDALVADALVRKGELIPTTVAEVRAAEADGVAFEGELPESLRELEAAPSTKSDGARRSTTTDRAASSQRIVSIDELRKAREDKAKTRASLLASFAAGCAVAAGIALFLRGSPGESPRHDQGASVPPLPSSSAVKSAEAISIPAVHAPCTDCCGGPSCGNAKGELRACASGRSCVACSESLDTTTAYRIRIANVVPAKPLDGISLASLDVCGRVTGGDWSCVPAYAEPKALPTSRALPRLASGTDLASGIDLELRPHDQKTVLGHWRDSVRLGPTILCRGAGALLTNDNKEDVGSVSFMLDDPYYVEIARSSDVGVLRSARAELSFADVTPSLVETTSEGPRRFALVAGPFDRTTADKLKWSLFERSQEADASLGEDYRGAPTPLP